MTLETIKYAPQKKTHKENPLGLLISVIKEKRNSSKRSHMASFKGLVLSEEFEEFLNSLIDEWLSIKYSTALGAANPPSVKEVTRRAAKKRQKLEDEKIDSEEVKALLGARILGMIAPNGKNLRDCTGLDCKKFGGFYARIGSKLKANETVGSAFSNHGILNEWKTNDENE